MNKSDEEKMLENINAVIFDVDGTIADSMWMWKEIDIEYLGRFGVELPKDLQKNIEGMSFKETAYYFKEHFGISDSVEQMMSDWNEMAAHKYKYEIPLKKGALEFFKLCKKRGLLLGIVTSNSSELFGYLLNAHNLEGFFDVIITGSDGLKGKPAPDMYIEAAKRLSVPVNKCLVFEDIIPGIMAGKNAGMKVCTIDDLYSRDVLSEKKKMADYYIESFEEILDTRA